MNERKQTKRAIAVILNCLVLVLIGAVTHASAQDAKDAKDAKTEKPAVKTGGRDPFSKFQPAVNTKAAVTVLTPPAIMERIERYRALKMAAANAHIAAPKPTTALLLNEIQVIGIFHTPRGWAAMVEAMPLNPKLSYVVYPGESFFDGQLVAIEENRLVFRRETVWTNGRRDKSVEVKALRQYNPVEAMTATQSPTAAPVEKSPNEQ